VAATPAPAPQLPEAPRAVEPQPEAPRVPQFEELILPSSSVIGLQLESTLTTERARVEDRVDARVTRDVLAAGRVAIPAGSRVLGSVTLVDRGGKVKERARLGVRFHTLVLADGNEVPLHTEVIYREGESPAGDSAKKIGVAAVGGAILGGILGGKKGAVMGGATGAAGGTAAVMQGDRNAASLRGGEIVTARLSAPATITVARRE
jgi:type IV secretory pathway VirB10-like protein